MKRLLIWLKRLVLLLFLMGIFVVLVKTEAFSGDGWENDPKLSNDYASDGLKLGKRTFEEHWLRQEDSWFSIHSTRYSGDELLEVRKIEASFSWGGKYTQTEADKLNGLKWGDWLFVKRALERSKKRGGAWSEWRQAGFMDTIIVKIHLAYKNDLWKIDDSDLQSFQKPTPEQVLSW